MSISDSAKADQSVNQFAVTRPERVLKPSDFAEFYAAVNKGHAPFPWQNRLVELACRGAWPAQIDLPTASGKSSIVEVAVFALACQASQAPVDKPTVLTMPRRIFFVVDRRIIVNEVHQRSQKLSIALADAVAHSADDSRDILATVAGWLRVVAGNQMAPPLDSFEMRGGIWRDDAWIRSPTQPTVLATTVDQIGSRMLFRGYGVSDRSLSIHAALVANDALVILDEGHLSRPFAQTVESIQRYRDQRWAEHSIPSPFHFVQMSATLSATGARSNEQVAFKLNDSDDYAEGSLLLKRHSAAKPTELVHVAGAKGKKLVSKMAKALAKEAVLLADSGTRKRIAVVVNRVNIAVETSKELAKLHPGSVHLMIGRMRPVDRDALTQQLLKTFGSGSNETLENPQFVVATQCLEVGADLDFDGMVCQCADISALRQRFGRLDRLGHCDGEARGVVVMADGDVGSAADLESGKNGDPIYGHGLTETWNWLNAVAVEVEPPSDTPGPEAKSDTSTPATKKITDFGIMAMNGLLQEHQPNLERLSAPQVDAPVLKPADMDRFAQTSPRPAIDPSPAAWLHGPRDSQSDVRVCWRADLPWGNLSAQNRITDQARSQRDMVWSNTVAACPPTVGECLSVPIQQFRNWLAGRTGDALDYGDVEGEAVSDLRKSTEKGAPSRRVVLWRGPKKMEVDRRSFSEGAYVTGCVDGRRPDLVRPNDTIVIPVELGGWESLGHVPDAPELPDLSPIEIQQKWLESTTHKTNSSVNEDGDSTRSKEIETEQQLVAKIEQCRRMDIGNLSYQASRARDILRVHPLLIPTENDLPYYARLLTVARDQEASLRTGDIAKQDDVKLETEEESSDSSKLSFSQWIKGRQLSRYPVAEFPFIPGLVVIGPRNQNSRKSILPHASFGEDDELSFSGQKLELVQHLADVEATCRTLATHLAMESDLVEVLSDAARYHDLGKCDPRFQAMLMGRPLSTAAMHRNLYAKSSGSVRTQNDDVLPKSFRHESLSVSLLEQTSEERKQDDLFDVMLHLIGSHHGCSRPLMPVCDDAAPPGISLARFGSDPISAENRRAWPALHRLDSSVGNRFWRTLRKFGWYGQAYLETLLRLSDWWASANPYVGDASAFEQAGKAKLPTSRPSSPSTRTSSTGSELVLSGLDAGRPLGYLAAIGLLRWLSSQTESQQNDGHDWTMAWKQEAGGWLPVLCTNHSGFSNADLLDLLERTLISVPQDHPILEAIEGQYGRTKKIKDEGKLKAEIRSWFAEAAWDSSPQDREMIDWMTSNGSDFGEPADASQLRTARADYFPGVIEKLIVETDRDHLHRTLFERWDYADRISGITLHLEPTEDRRHAYQWYTPSGDPSSKVTGGMIGANRLAIEAWPLFQSVVDDRQELRTVGFRGTKANNTFYSWPVWTGQLSIDMVQTALGLADFQSQTTVASEAILRGIEEVYRCQRILRGKTPNLTPAVSVPYTS